MRTKKSWNSGNKNALGNHTSKPNSGRRKILTEEDRAIRKENNKIYNREKNRERRIICLVKYSGIPPKCACCGENIMEFLSVDHINGGGNKHREEIGVGKSIYPWLIRNNFPKGFQILCYNCNMAKGFCGKCPHKLQK